MTVAIIGGGWAGLAAAITLTQQQVSVKLFESAAQFGGRARRLHLNNVPLDNGQHILIGAYRETFRVMQLVGVNIDDVCYAPPLTLKVFPSFHLQAARLPAPWHLGVGLFRSKGISFPEKLSALRFLLALKRYHFAVDPAISVTTLLDQQRQNARLNDYLWHPLCLAALNTPPAIASAQIFVNVLRDAFFTTANASRLLLPQLNLGALFPDVAAQHLRAHGASLSLNQRVHHIDFHDGRFTLHHAHGTENFTRVISAVAPFHLAKLLGSIPVMQPIIAQLSTWDYQPIYTVYLQYDASVRLTFPMLGLSQTISQWVFDRRLTHQPGLLAVVISAHGAHTAWSHEKLAQRVQEELKQALGISTTPHWTQVIAEKRATFSCTPKLFRPENQTPLPGLCLAGDYTASEYPATLEAAVRSGVKSARLILSSLSKP